METIQIDKIVIKDNVRKDYGDLTEMTASIKEHGVRKPVELNKRNELVDGYRRLKAAKAAGLTDIPYFYNDDKIDNTTEQILSGIFSKNLNAVEEGKAYQKYIDEHKLNIKDFARKISKREDYIEKRLKIAGLHKEIQDELIAGKIEIGHALLLARMPEPDARKYIKEIIRDKKTVDDAKDGLQYISKRISSAPFDKSECKGCEFNGSEQSELFETGKILNGVCLNKSCYIRKMQEFMKAMKEKYKDVLVKEAPKGYVRGDYEWECKEKGITEIYKNKCRETKENYAVTIDESEYSAPKIVEWFKPKSKKESEKTTEAKEEIREQRFDSKIEIFKREFLINKCEETIKPGSKEAKALAMIEMDSSNEVKKAFEMTEKDIDKCIAEASISALRNMGMKDLLIATGKNGVDIEKQFQITKEFLELHTKDQLIDLIKELKLKIVEGDMSNIEKGNVKRDDLIKIILDSDIKGKVPKAML